MSVIRNEHQRQLVLDKLAQVWKAYPYQRLCQLIVNATRDDPFYVEDDDLMASLDALARGWPLPRERYKR